MIQENQPSLFDFIDFDEIEDDEDIETSFNSNPESIIKNLGKSMRSALNVRVEKARYRSALTDGQIDVKVLATLGSREENIHLEKSFNEILFDAAITPDELSDALARLIFEEHQIGVRNIVDGYNIYKLLTDDERRPRKINVDSKNLLPTQLSKETEFLLKKIVVGTKTISGKNDPDIAIRNGLSLLWNEMNDQARREAVAPEVSTDGSKN